MTKVLEPGILKTKNFERMANDLDRHLQVRNIKYQTQFNKLSAIARKCAENALAAFNRFSSLGDCSFVTVPTVKRFLSTCTHDFSAIGVYFYVCGSACYFCIG
jgi:hypothetical protein